MRRAERKLGSKLDRSVKAMEIVLTDETYLYRQILFFLCREEALFLCKEEQKGNDEVVGFRGPDGMVIGPSLSLKLFESNKHLEV